MPTKKPNSSTEIANAMSSLSFQDPPKPKSKGLNVLAEYEKSKVKNAANFVVIGMCTL
jgi:elongation factor 1 alpha-like protein